MSRRHPTLAETIAAAAAEKRILFKDGATGTELAARGCDTSLPLWSAPAATRDSDTLLAIHRDYRVAGADILIANTFRTTPRTWVTAQEPMRMRSAPLPANRWDAATEWASTLLEASVARARQALAFGHTLGWVAGSLAPLEDCYELDWVPDDASLVREHSWIAHALKRAGVDAIWIETMNTLREAEAATAAAAATGLPVLLAATGRDDGLLFSGEPWAALAEIAERHGCAAVGVNCSTPTGTLAAVRALRDVTALPITAAANSGSANNASGWTPGAVGPAAFAAHAAEWAEAGATIVGGCCGTGPAHIGACVERLRPPKPSGARGKTRTMRRKTGMVRLDDERETR
jgi:S-methylmethionine-dependent homocysteine/selenocysteine methylase